MAKNINGDRFDPSFYTEFRYQGAPQDVINEFSGAATQLLKRLIDDLRSTLHGPFGTESPEENEAMAVAVERNLGHVEVFRGLALGENVPPEPGAVLTNIVANVLADANAAGTALARAKAPKAREAKFDQGKTGSAVEGMKEYASKIKNATAGVGKIIAATEIGDPIGKLIEGIGAVVAAVLEDIAISGARVAKHTGGNEATRQIEEKLDYAIPVIDGIKERQNAVGTDIQKIGDDTKATRAKTEVIAAEVDNIEIKANTLGRLLGKTLVGEEWDVHPHTVDASLGLAGLGKIPAVSIKDEMHSVEDNIDVIINELNQQKLTIININVFILAIIQFIINIFPTQFFFFFQKLVKVDALKPPKGVKPLIDERLKKIFVYEEDRFTPQSAADRKTIKVKTGAFDLTGWIDLTNLRAGDAVDVGTFVTVAGKRRRLSQKRFDHALLVPFADIARGLNYISGSDISVQIRQPLSADGFRQKVEIGYQFVVESQ